MLNRLRKDDKGLGIIELLIIVLFIGVLVGIVGYTYSGIKSSSRNNKREAQLRILQEYVENFYSHNMYYPTLADMNNPNWLAANIKGFTSSMIQDPSWTATNKFCSVNQKPVLISHSQHGCFGYAPTNNGVSCATLVKSCNHYTLTATLEQSNTVYTLRQLD